MLIANVNVEHSIVVGLEVVLYLPACVNYMNYPSTRSVVDNLMLEGLLESDKLESALSLWNRVLDYFK